MWLTNEKSNVAVTVMSLNREELIKIAEDAMDKLKDNILLIAYDNYKYDFIIYDDDEDYWNKKSAIITNVEINKFNRKEANELLEDACKVFDDTRKSGMEIHLLIPEKQLRYKSQLFRNKNFIRLLRNISMTKCSLSAINGFHVKYVLNLVKIMRKISKRLKGKDLDFKVELKEIKE